MSEYVAKQGTTALGIIGTVLGAIGTAAAGGNGAANLFNANGGGGMNNMQMVIAEKDAELARYRSEKYTDEHILELYQYIDGRLRSVEQNINDNAAAQAVINCQNNSAIQLLNQNIVAINNTLALITKTAVPSSIVVDFSSTTTSTT